MKILVGLSGGVDSTYTAYKLKQSGHNVEGLCLIMHDYTDVEGARKAGVDCAAVRCGYSKDGELVLAEPKFIFDDLFALREFLLKNAEER